MPTQGTSVADRSSVMTPVVVCNHPDDVAEVRAETGYRLFVRFVDCTSGIVDLSALVSSPQAGVFAALRNQETFADVGLNLGAVTWPDGLDLAPDAMYAALRESGYWKPE